MFLRLLLLFTVVPLVELSLLIRIGEAIGLGPTVALILCTGAIGAALARQQGLRTVAKLREDLAGGRKPGDTLLDGILILVAGAVLVTPGVLTDLVGFGLLIPPIRALVRGRLAGWAKDRVQVVQVDGGGPERSGGREERPDDGEAPRRRRGPDDDVIDVDWEIREEEPGSAADEPSRPGASETPTG